MQNLQTKFSLYFSLFFVLVFSNLNMLHNSIALKSNSDSNFSSALSYIGFNGVTLNVKKYHKTVEEVVTAKEQHIAFVENCFMSSLFSYGKLMLSYDRIFTSSSNKDREVFRDHVGKLLTKSNAIKGNIKKFQAEYILDNLFELDIFKNKNDVYDFIIAWTQTGYKKTMNKESDEIDVVTLSNASKKHYIRNSEKLGFIKSIFPDVKKVNEVFILGASRPSLLRRFSNFKDFQEEHGFKFDKLRVLTGSRRLWSEIDGISPNSRVSKAEEGRDYILQLAKKQSVPFSEEQPFSVIKNRTYLNDNGEVDEYMMSKDICSQVFSAEKCNEFQFINTSEFASFRDRPDTITTLEDALLTYSIPNYLNKDQISILIVSNQPYGERQFYNTYYVVNKILKSNNEDLRNYDIKIDLHLLSYGSAKKGEKIDSIALLESELFASVFSRFQSLFVGIERQRDIKKLTASYFFNLK